MSFPLDNERFDYHLGAQVQIWKDAEKDSFALRKNVLRGAIDAEKAICSGIQLSFRMDGLSASKLPMVMNSQPDLF